MLRIAAVANTYKDVKQFVEYKFRDKIQSVNLSKGIYTLINGDEIHLCYDEDNKNKFLSATFDAYVVHWSYHSLLDVIIQRSGRS